MIFDNHFNSVLKHYATCCWVLVVVIVASQVDCATIKDGRQNATTPTRSSGPVRRLESASLEQAGQQVSSISPMSYKIIAAGWPLTSPMWPTIDTHEVGNENGSNQLVEPFIYADEPRQIDYSLLLSLNKTLIELIKNVAQKGRQIGVNLSFEYYFNHDHEVETTPPAIKIEIDRSEFRFLRPGLPLAQGGGEVVKTKMWTKFNERIRLDDFSGLDNDDWLKFSLVNRKAYSLVAIRRLKVDFIAAASMPSGSTGASLPQPPIAGQPLPPVLPADNELAPPASQPNAQTLRPFAPTGPQVPADELPPGLGDQPTPVDELEPAGPLLEPGGRTAQASNVLTSTIKPVTPRKSSWAPWGKGRRKRQAADEQQPAAPKADGETTLVQLTCYSSNSCEFWRATQSSDRIQWSLARMPSTIGAIKRGYYYVSNLGLNYGDSSKLLRLELNETEQATNADRASAYCIELALYVTERTRLKLYRLERAQVGETNKANWTKGSLLLSWAPTVAVLASSEAAGGQSRQALPGSQMASLNQSGWTFEQICFGQFFTNLKECGMGQCAFGFEMATGGEPAATNAASDGQQPSGQDLQQRPSSSLAPDLAENEQVVGVAILREFALSVPKKPAARWLQTWNRPQVTPSLDWRYFPSSDSLTSSENVSLANLHDGAHYSIQSEWIQADEALDFDAILSVEINLSSADANNSSTAIQSTMVPSNAGQPQAAPVNAPSPVDGISVINWQPSEQLFSLRVTRKLVNSNFEPFFELSSPIDWFASDLISHNLTSTGATKQLIQYNLSLPNLGELIRSARQTGKLETVSAASEQTASENLFKIIIEFELDCHWPSVKQLASSPNAGRQQFRLVLSNVSLSDRCFPSPCQHGECKQNGTQLDDWLCDCDERHRGRRCEFGRWCDLAHVLSPSLSSTALQSGQLSQAKRQQQAAGLELFGQPTAKSSLRIVAPGQQQSQAAQPQQQQQQQLQANINLSGQRFTGREFCSRKLGFGSECNEIDLHLNNETYVDEGKTFVCACQDDYYLSDDGKCRQAHQCNSIVCPEIGQICDESKPFDNRTTQHCVCNERQDWYPDPTDSGKCIRRQCHDKMRDCGFDAHVCLPTLPGERPICKCGPKFVLKVNEKTAKKECHSAACFLPTLNDCQHICQPDHSNLERPWTCSCHPGYTLDKTDHRTCRPTSSSLNGKPSDGDQLKLNCKPACDSRTQICTEFGCKCKQGFVPDGEVKIKVDASRLRPHHISVIGTNTSTVVDYTQSVRCLNVCSLSYAENKEQFERVESVCPLGLCDPSSFECRCSDPNSSALVHTKYEPIWLNETAPPAGEPAPAPVGEDGVEPVRRRASPLCHLKRVCQRESASYQLCMARGAICVPDYARPAMFDCVCPPSSEKRLVGPTGEFVCEPRCSSIRQECLKKQAICRPIDKDQVRCDCLPGMMMDQKDQKCYLARYSYSLNLVLVNKYYEPESRFHKLVSSGAKNETAAAHQPASFQAQPPQEPSGDGSLADDAPHFQDIMPQYQRQPGLEDESRTASMLSSIFITEYNQCNISQVIPKSVIEDPYEHDMESYLGYIDQCNERVHENARTHRLNSKLSEDLRQSLRQHLSDFTVTTNHSLCHEIPLTFESEQQQHQHHHLHHLHLHHTTHQSAAPINYLNCTIFLQSMEPIDEALIAHVFNNCDKNGADPRFCWIKPRLLLAKPQHYGLMLSQQNLAASNNQTLNYSSPVGSSTISQFQFKQVIPCELEGFCGDDAYSVRHDDKSSICSCKCPADIEMIDLKELEARHNFIQGPNSPAVQQHVGAVKEICAPRNRCSALAGGNATVFCLFKPGSVCHYDIRTGSVCKCVYPAYEDSEGRCVEVTFSSVESTLIVIIIMIGTSLIVSIALNLYALMRSKRGLFGHSKQYPLHEFSSASAATANNNSRPLNRSTGMPNLAFNSDED